MSIIEFPTLLNTQDRFRGFSAKPHEVNHDWFVIDATNKVLGRLASQIAHRLRGKHKPIYTPHVDTGDYIIVINADNYVTGNKADDKFIIAIPADGIYATTFRKCTLVFLIVRLKKLLRHVTEGTIGICNAKKLKVYAGDSSACSAA